MSQCLFPLCNHMTSPWRKAQWMSRVMFSARPIKVSTAKDWVTQLHSMSDTIRPIHGIMYVGVTKGMFLSPDCVSVCCRNARCFAFVWLCWKSSAVGQCLKKCCRLQRCAAHFKRIQSMAEGSMDDTDPHHSLHCIENASLTLPAVSPKTSALIAM